MNFRNCIETKPAILMEGALGERLKREHNIIFDKFVAMAGLIYEKKSASALSSLWNEYIEIARKYQLPFIATTPTRRANRERIHLSQYSENIIVDNSFFNCEFTFNDNIDPDSNLFFISTKGVVSETTVGIIV